MPGSVVAGRVAESVPAGPELAGWLATAQPGEVEDGALAGMAASFRRLASWAQAGELAAVAQLVSRTAAGDEKIGVADDGRPARVPASACSQVALGLVMSEYGAAWWADLAVTLTWRLQATGAALQAGQIDLSRARLIAEQTAALSDAAARDVEQKVLPRAGEQTNSQLRAALRYAVIAADPQGAERRREDAERQAKVSLYGDADNTATLTGSGLPVAQAAAAMARITALARALKSSGAPGGLNLHRARVFLGLLLGTLPYIPPAEGAPADLPPDLPPDPPRSDSPSDDPAAPAGPAGSWEDVPCPGDEDAPCDDDAPSDHGSCSAGAVPGDAVPADADEDEEDFEELSGPAPAWPDLPAGAAPAGTPPAVIPPGGIPPAFTQPGSAGSTGRPAAGLLDVTVPWLVLAGLSTGPGLLGRIGPVTASQATRLADAAASDPAAHWRIIVTSSDGQAMAVTRIPRPSLPRDGPAAGTGLAGRVTLTISEGLLTSPPDLTSPAGPGSPPGTGSPRNPGQSPDQGPGPPAEILTAALQAAARALAQARELARIDMAAGGGCAHADRSHAYRPPPRLQEYIVARDQTCRFLRCRQPAWRGDLDHTTPWPEGKTCRCNLGGVCRTHHQLKQHPGWTLRQIRPGTFEWTTPSGRTYLATPDTYPV